MTKILYSLGVIGFGLSLGYVVQILVQKGRISLPIEIDDLRKLLQKIALLGLNPVMIIGAVWIVELKSARLVALPFTGLFALMAGGLLALAASRTLHLEPRKTGAMFGCGSFTNIGAIGALTCFIYLGEPGFALVSIYKLFEETFYYSVGFPIAKYYSASDRPGEPAGSRLKALLKDPFIIVAISSILIGGILNFSGVDRPIIYGTINAIFVPMATVMLLTSIGLALRFRKVRDYLREAASVSLIKFLIVPILTTTVAFLLGFGDIGNGLPLKVVIILSSMPVAFNALIPPSIYDLDLDLANSCWFVTTALLIVVLPVLMFVINAV
ncbi:hypothetical protein D3OALGA1CA_462 [Olavius algarvensis associated proteobacterium Delta 3]|nr:hypothetical protein D3OALGB2SA_476 [Olavius algarvensis associated proteobacterium Delta 3]CAB5084555.1 hypothetical protein D3OALGA1CA_462 [Olavius algarvensis associated proteobacterium Delta 3]